MTIEEMHELCDILMDKNNAPWFNSTEKDRFIRLAELEFVKQQVDRYEVDEKGRKNIQTLVRKYTSVPAISAINVDSAIPELMYIVQVSGDFVDSCNNIDREAIVPIQLDDELDLTDDPFFKLGYNTRGYRETYENGYREVQFITDSYPSNVILRYIKKPRDVNRDESVPANSVNSELPVHVHEEVVNIAVRKMVGSVQDQFQYQVQQNEEQKT